MAFNSNMVRLQENIFTQNFPIYVLSIPIWCDYKVRVGVGLVFRSVFQFQYGAITSDNPKDAAGYSKRFQFQYGAITSAVTGTNVLESVRFQFQYGAITRMRYAPDQGLDIYFQFQYGAITRKN